MGKINILLVFGLIITEIVFAITKPLCETKYTKFKICKTANILVSVTEVSSEKFQKNSRESLYIEDEEISTISSMAFRNLSIVELIIVLKNANLNLEKESFSGLPCLQSLQILSGIVSIKPDLFIRVPNIDYLVFRMNGQNQKLALAFPELKKLTTMKVYESNFDEMDIATFFNLSPKISSLILEGNNILNVRFGAFITLTDLKLLELIGNNIQNIKIGAFVELNSLVTIRIINEKIKIIEEGVFNELRSLKSLTITSSKVNKIKSGAFRGLTLESLIITNNSLSVIERNTFVGLKTQFLNLSMNQISIIQENAFVDSMIERLFFSYLEITKNDEKYWGLKNSTRVSIAPYDVEIILSQ